MSQSLCLKVLPVPLPSHTMSVEFASTLLWSMVLLFSAMPKLATTMPPVAAVGFVAPWHQLLGEKFMTAVAFDRAVGSRWVVNVILAAALLSLFKCFNGNFVAASRLLFALGRRGMVDVRAGQVHAQYQTPSVATLCVGLATAACMLLGDAILVPITEVGSVACAIGWAATCAACLYLARTNGTKSIRLSAAGWIVAVVGLLVGIAMALMKILPGIPGHFTMYEWLALAAWIALGAIARRALRNEEN